MKRLLATGFQHLILGIFLILPSLSSPSQAQNDAQRCDAAIPVSVPKFSCSAGVVVPKTIAMVGGHATCDKPEDLYTRCVFKSTLGKLEAANNKDVEIIFSCRKDLTGTHQNDTSNIFHDIAVIQHNKKTGATCFYQHLGNHDGNNLPAPGGPGGAAFWNASTHYCSSCHTNGPFVRELLSKPAGGVLSDGWQAFLCVSRLIKCSATPRKGGVFAL